MKKRYADLTEQEQSAFVNELVRIHTFGSACLIASEINVGQKHSGWPFISVCSGVDDVQVSMCDALEVLRDHAKLATMQEFQDLTAGLFGFLLQQSIPDVEELAVHAAMHDAFCLGIAAVSLLELDFSGVEDILAQLNENDDHVE